MSGQINTDVNPKLQEFFNTSLQELYWSETNLINVLTTMSEGATDPQLKEAFQLHTVETREHVKRLEQVFQLLNMQPAAEPSAGLQGLFDEGWQIIDETETGSTVRDVALIIAAQKVEHYEIACYGSLITLALTIGQNKVARILGATLQEEKRTDAILTSIAGSGINEEAVENEQADGSEKAVSGELAVGATQTGSDREMSGEGKMSTSRQFSGEGQSAGEGRNSNRGQLADSLQSTGKESFTGKKGSGKQQGGGKSQGPGKKQTASSR